MRFKPVNVVQPRLRTLALGMLVLGGASPARADGGPVVLPFPQQPSASTVGVSLDDSHHQWRAPAVHLPAGAPNVLVIMLDDAGFAQSDVVGGPIHTPTLARIADTGIRYNRFHTTAISSATRASLLTGRNPHRVGNGTITELANDFDGYTAVIPKTSATVAEVLRQYGYQTAAFGKWHNTPTSETSAMGPFGHWPTGYGFEHFYGFLGAESDQYQPHLVNDTTRLAPPTDPQYQLGGDLAQQAINWLDQRQAYAPDRPFFMYWAPGGVHAPHQVAKAWSDKYKGRFDAGWDALRQQVYEREKQLGWIPADTVLTPRPKDMPAWDSLNPEERRFQARLMEVYAGFLEYTDTQAGRVVDELERLGLRQNTLIVYMFSDNGASAEGMQGAINDVVSVNGIPTTVQQHMRALAKLGGLDVLGGPSVHEHYSAAWAWAGETPFVGTKLVAGYFGGTRAPMAISWPKRIAHDTAMRSQFLHVNDIVPTIYEAAGVTAPASVNGLAQDPIDGMSFLDSFTNAAAPTHKRHQYFEMLGSRAEYADDWIASVFGPRTPWKADMADLLTPAGKIAFLLHQPAIGDALGWLKWKPERDQWALYDLRHDYAQANDVAAAWPAKLKRLQQLFDQDARANRVYPIGAGLYSMLHPEQRPGENGRTEWHFGPVVRGLPEFAAPNIRARDHKVTVRAELPAGAANGVLFCVGEASAGLALYLKDGYLVYEYNAFSLERLRLRSPARLPPGQVTIKVEMRMAGRGRGAPADVTLSANGQTLARGRVPMTAPFGFTANGALDVGADTGSPVSPAYPGVAPYAFNGIIRDVHIEYR